MSKIKIMDSQLANRIAAGEVVERPSGVIKELVENSIDAKANHIIIETINGGLDLIRVIDNGEGILNQDLELAFCRHSTSKIQSVADLDKITSLGFRGEALASIASVSNIDISTNGLNLVLDNGYKQSLNSIATNPGCDIKVTQLFHSVPARLKYLKQISYEAARNFDIIKSFALGYPQISFELYSDQKLVFKSHGDDVKHVIHTLYGMEIGKECVAFHGQNYDFEIDGCYVMPHFHRGNKYHIYLYLNQRMIKYYKVSQRIVDVFGRYMPHDRFPIIVLNIRSDYSLVDVNVHPAKWEIRLQQEDSLLTLVEETLLSSLETALKPKKATPFFRSEAVEMFSFDQVVSSHENSELGYEINEIKSDFNRIMVIGQHHGKYILAQDQNQLYIFDQHASNERIMYEYFLDKFNQLELPTQLLLEPLVIGRFPFIAHNLVLINQKLTNLHLELELFGQDQIIIRSVPAYLIRKDIDLLAFLNVVLDKVESDQDLSLASLDFRFIATRACKSSIRFNHRLSLLECQTLVDDLMKCEQKFHCPHGRPTFIVVDENTLLKEFAR